MRRKAVSKARIAMFSMAFLLAGAVALAADRTIIWSNEEGEGNVPMDNAGAAYSYCQPRGGSYPEAGNELTACEQEWWNDGNPLPSGGTF